MTAPTHADARDALSNFDFERETTAGKVLAEYIAAAEQTEQRLTELQDQLEEVRERDAGATHAQQELGRELLNTQRERDELKAKLEYIGSAAGELPTLAKNARLAAVLREHGKAALTVLRRDGFRDEEEAAEKAIAEALKT